MFTDILTSIQLNSILNSIIAVEPLQQFLCICEIKSKWPSYKSINLTKFNGLDTSSLFDGLNTSSIDLGPSDDHWEDAFTSDLSYVTKVRMGILFIFMVLGIPSNVIILAVSIINKRKQPNSAYLLMNMAKGLWRWTFYHMIWFISYSLYYIRFVLLLSIRLFTLS